MKRKSINSTAWALLLSLLTTTLSSCNFYSFLDGPGDDDGNLQKARARLDLTDYACALEYYAKVSDAYKNSRESEIAFTIMAQNGVTFGTILASFGNGAGGRGITTLANRLIGVSTASRRATYYTAYAKNTGITDTQLAGLVKFVSSISIAAGILAENAGSDNLFGESDVTGDPTGCKVSSASCSAPANFLPGSGTFDSSGAGGTANMGLFHAAISAADAALNEVGKGGSIGSGAGGLSAALAALGQPTTEGAAAQAFRSKLLEQKVGTP